MVLRFAHRWDSTGADYIFIPEQPPLTDSWEDEMCEVLKSVSLVGKPGHPIRKFPFA